jgi:hypothetical protein
MLGPVEEPDRRLAGERPESDEEPDVDDHRGDQAGSKGQAGHFADARHLGCADAKSGNQPPDEDRQRSPTPQQMSRAFQPRPEAQRVCRFHQRRPANRRKDFPADDGPHDGSRKERGDHRNWFHCVAGDRDPGDDQEQIAGREGDRDPGFLDENESRDDADQEVAAQSGDRANRVHPPASAPASRSVALTSLGAGCLAGRRARA